MFGKKTVCALVLALGSTGSAFAAVPYCGVTSTVYWNSASQPRVTVIGWHTSATPYSFDLQYKVDGAATWSSAGIAQNHTVNNSATTWGLDAFLPTNITSGLHSVQVRLVMASAPAQTRFCGVTQFVAQAAADPVGECFYENNAEHIAGGRAHAMYGMAYANGSNDSMGMATSLPLTLLQKTGPGYFDAVSGCY